MVANVRLCAMMKRSLPPEGFKLGLLFKFIPPEGPEQTSPELA